MRVGIARAVEREKRQLRVGASRRRAVPLLAHDRLDDVALPRLEERAAAADGVVHFSPGDEPADLHLARDAGNMPGGDRDDRAAPSWPDLSGSLLDLHADLAMRNIESQRSATIGFDFRVRGDEEQMSPSIGGVKRSAIDRDSSRLFFLR